MGNERHEFEIKIDAEDYTVDQKEMTAGDVLALADKSYPTFHLVMLRGNDDPTEYMDAADVVKLHNAMEFTTKHVGPTTVS